MRVIGFFTCLSAALALGTLAASSAVAEGMVQTQSFDREYIEESSERTTEEFLRNLPIANANGVPISNNATGFTPGATGVSLRGLPASDTLLLINRRPVATYPIGTGVFSTQAFVDLNSIPFAAIQKIDILGAAGATTHGNGGVSGVIDITLGVIITGEFKSAQQSLEYGSTLDKDSEAFSSSLAFVVGSAGTSISGVLNYYHRNSIFNRDRDYSARPMFLSSNSNPGNFQLTAEAVIEAGGRPVVDPFGGPLPVFFGSPGPLANGNVTARDYLYTSTRSQTFNPNQFSGSVPDSERYGGYANFEHDVFGSSVQLYGDVFYQNVKTHQELAPAFTGSFQSTGVPTIAIPPRHPGETLGGPTYEETDLVEGAYNPFNPFQQIISGGSRYRLADFGNRLLDAETDVFFTTVGVKGDRIGGTSWGYDGGFRYSEVQNVTTGTFVSRSRFNRILNAADPIFNPNSPEFIGTTVPYNPFGDFRRPIASNAIPIAFATVHPKEVDTSTLAIVDFLVYSTSLFQLPAGGIGFAAGAQFRRETLRQDPDALLTSNDLIASTFGTPSGLLAAPAQRTVTSGGKTAASGYAEVSVPIFSSAFCLPGFYSLQLDVSGRYEQLLSNDTDVFAPKVAMMWQPVGPSLSMRGSWNKGFREPSLIELYGSPSRRLTAAFGPVGDIIVPLIVRSNPHLDSEESNIFSAGVVLRPKFLHGLTATADLFDIEMTNRIIDNPALSDVLEREQRGRLFAGERVIRDPSGVLVAIESPFRNGGAQTVRGLDLGLRYEVESSCGKFTWRADATYMDAIILTRDIAGLVDDRKNTVNLRGRTTDEFASNEGYLKWKGLSRLDWDWNGFSLAGTVRYIDGFHEHKPNALVHWVSQEWLFDLEASYEFTFRTVVEEQVVSGYSKDLTSAVRLEREPATGDNGAIWKRVLSGTSLGVGCQNVFDQDPPKAYGFGGNGINYPGYTYDASGRFVYVRLRKSF